MLTVSLLIVRILTVQCLIDLDVARLNHLEVEMLVYEPSIRLNHLEVEIFVC